MSPDLLVLSVCSVFLVLRQFPAQSKHRALISYHLPVEKAIIQYFHQYYGFKFKNLKVVKKSCGQGSGSTAV